MKGQGRSRGSVDPPLQRSKTRSMVATILSKTCWICPLSKNTSTRELLRIVNAGTCNRGSRHAHWRVLSEPRHRPSKQLLQHFMSEQTHFTKAGDSRLDRSIRVMASTIDSRAELERTSDSDATTNFKLAMLTAMVLAALLEPGRISAILSISAHVCIAQNDDSLAG